VAPVAIVIGVLLGLAPALLVIGIVLFRRGHRRSGGTLIGLAVVLFAFGAFLLATTKPYRVPSEAMAPTLKIGDRFLASRDGDFEIGDIVVFHPPTGAIDGACGAPESAGEICSRPTPGRSPVTFVKRVVAGPNDHVAIRGGRVIRDGRRLAEPYIRECEGGAAHCDFRDPVVIPAGHYLMLGDNRGASDDSRFWGPVPEEWIEGRILFRYWPVGRIGKP
jgi:signal peptidase I